MTLENAWGFFAFDVSTYLLIAMVLTFIIVIIDKFYFDKNNNKIQSYKFKNPISKWIYFALFLRFNSKQKYAHRPKIVQWSAEVFPVLLLVFMIRSFLIEPFQIPSNSMMPTLLTGDFIVVNKTAYSVRLPLTNQKIFNISSPKRGDVVVFRYPNYEKDYVYKGADFIKRIIGLPGDKIIYQNDKLTINGKNIEYKKLDTYVGIKSGISVNGFNHSKELLPYNPHSILINPEKTSREVKLIVPAGHYFVMGDNRDRSSDSRFWGFVPDEYLIGKAFAVWMYYDDGFNFSRIGFIH